VGRHRRPRCVLLTLTHSCLEPPLRSGPSREVNQKQGAGHSVDRTGTDFGAPETADNRAEALSAASRIRPPRVVSREQQLVQALPDAASYRSCCGASRLRQVVSGNPLLSKSPTRRAPMTHRSRAAAPSASLFAGGGRRSVRRPTSGRCFSLEAFNFRRGQPGAIRLQRRVKRRRQRRADKRLHT
jgi:hypothetical protein